jgi:excisionase family DNA binding protein
MTLTLAEIARRLGKPRGTVWAAAKRNCFPWTQSGKSVLAELEDVQAYFENNRNSKKKS